MLESLFNESSRSISVVSDRPTDKSEGTARFTFPTLQMRATAIHRHNHAWAHMLAAAEMARVLHEHEIEFGHEGFGPHFDKSRHYAIAAILLVVSSLEANFNELQEAIGVPQTLRDVWERKNILTKHQALLAHLKLEPIDEGLRLIQSLKVLIELRNTLTHPHPMTFEGHQETTDQKFQKRLRNERFAFSPFTPKDGHIYPIGCMSYGCVTWAIDVVSGLIRDLNERVHPKRNESPDWIPPLPIASTV